ncbi:MAG: glycosyltransferase, partial [Mesorhizobium sp.]
YMETKRRPLYLINEIAAHDPAAGKLPVHRLQEMAHELTKGAARASGRV